MVHLFLGIYYHSSPMSDWPQYFSLITATIPACGKSSFIILGFVNVKLVFAFFFNVYFKMHIFMPVISEMGLLDAEKLDHRSGLFPVAPVLSALYKIHGGLFSLKISMIYLDGFLK
jgi:hypothetical protein